MRHSQAAHRRQQNLGRECRRCKRSGWKFRHKRKIQGEAEAAKNRCDLKIGHFPSDPIPRPPGAGTPRRRSGPLRSAPRGEPLHLGEKTKRAASSTREGHWPRTCANRLLFHRSAEVVLAVQLRREPEAHDGGRRQVGWRAAPHIEPLSEEFEDRPKEVRQWQAE